jgi:predicted RNA-binding protein associated with RNAse of E/G family
VEPLKVGSEVVVRRVKLTKDDVLYSMTVESDDGDHVVVVGPFSGSAARDLGYVTFAPGDHFVEHFWRTRWYSLADVHDPTGGRKGWYCDVTRPAEVAPGSIVSADLLLDVWVPAGDGPVLTLDEDEFAASGLSHTDPDVAAHARQALSELYVAAQDRFTTLLG